MKVSRPGPPPLAAGLVVLAVVAGCGQASPAPGTPGNGAKPAIAIASFFPLTVRGLHFRPDTRVALLAQPREAGLKPVYARVAVGRDGSFTVRLRGYGLDPCTGVTVTATTPAHVHISVSSHPRACPPVPVPSGSGRS